MKLHILYTEKWDEILDAIKEAQEYFKDFDIQITSSYVELDVRNEAFYETTYSWSGLTRKATKSIKSSVIQAVGKLKNPSAEFYGIMVDKSKAMEESTLNGQASYSKKTLEVYCKRTRTKRYEMAHNTYTLIHEIFHLIEKQMGLGEALHEYLAGKPKNLDAFRQSLIQEPKQTYKHFTEDEVVGLKPSFVEKLDQAREIAGIPFAFTSGYRTVAYNKKIGGVPNSLHIQGLAADIRCRNSEERYKIVDGALQAGINEITVYTKSGHVHLADDDEKTLSVLNK